MISVKVDISQQNGGDSLSLTNEGAEQHSYQNKDNDSILKCTRMNNQSVLYFR